MFGRKKDAPQAKPRRPGGIGQFGLMDMGMDDSPGDDDLEAELAALSGGGKKKRPAEAVKKKLVSPEALQAMIAESLKDIPSDEELSDVEDSDLEAELGGLIEDDDEEEAVQLAPPKPKQDDSAQVLKTLKERLSMYQEAEKNAKSAGDNMKARRVGRGIKTLQDMLKVALAGKPIDQSEIPPPVAVSSQPKPPPPVEAPARQEMPTAEMPVIDPEPVPEPKAEGPLIDFEHPNEPAKVTPTTPAPEPFAPSVDDNTLRIMQARKDEYKRAALEAKKAGQQDVAIKYVRIVKQFDQVIAAAQEGQPVDLAAMPPPPSAGGSPAEVPTQVTSVVKPEPPPQPRAERQLVQGGADPMEAPLPDALPSADVPIPTTALEALQQRLVKYQSQQAQAEAEGNSSKARRMGRIVKQYTDAIKACKAGKTVPFDELPTPPGYPPIPGAPKATEEPVPLIAAAAAAAIIPEPQPQPQAPAPPQPSQVARPAPPPPSPAKPEVKADSVRKNPQSRQEKQLQHLLEQQRLFKEAALEAKKRGEVPQAKEYLRMAKGIDPLIEASKSGLPVDLNTVPVPPQAREPSPPPDASFEFLDKEECALAPALGEDDDLYKQVENDLVAQLKICTDNRAMYTAVGDVANANRFDQLSVFTKKDLDRIRYAAKRGDPVPRFKYETKTFSIVRCCTDLKEDEMDIVIVRGLSYTVPNPKTIDTYVKFEVPLSTVKRPDDWTWRDLICCWCFQDNPFRNKTTVIKDTNSPEYNQNFVVPIARTSRALPRIFKNKAVKFEVWAKGGFLRSDSLIGTAQVKLAHLQTHSVLHEAVELMDGRKAVGGKLEVKIRLREPLLAKEVEQVQEKWTVLVE